MENNTDVNTSVETTTEVENNFKSHEKIISPTKLMFLKFKANKLAMFGLISFLAILLGIVIATIYTKAVDYKFYEMYIYEEYATPSLDHLFGTDRYGRDYFIRVWAAGWVTVQFAFIVTAVSVVMGIAIGAVSGFAGGKVDLFLMRLAEIVSSFPFLALAITIATILSDYTEQRRVLTLALIMGLLRWTGLARMVRGQILSIKKAEFITATKALGISRTRQITRHIVPNVLAYVVVSGTMSFAGAILSESSLSFLGLSMGEPLPTWGGLLQRAQTNATAFIEYPWLWITPGVLLFMFIMSANLIGEGLRDAIDPKASVSSGSKKHKKHVAKVIEDVNYENYSKEDFLNEMAVNSNV